MCRLLGIIANKEVDLRFSLFEGNNTLETMGETNPDGWGLGWYEGNKPGDYKEPIRPSYSKEFHRNAADARSRIFVGHVRKATAGSIRKENCHPFSWNRWLFAHNGSVDRDKLMSLLEMPNRKALKGETDSEVYFQWILQCIESERDVEKGIKAAINMVRQYAHSGLNFILADGRTLYAYRDALENHAHYSLFFLLRDPREFGPVTFRSLEVKTLLESKTLNQERAVLVCSERLTEEKWKEIPLGNLLIVSGDLAPRLVKVK